MDIILCKNCLNLVPYDETRTCRVCRCLFRKVRRKLTPDQNQLGASIFMILLGAIIFAVTLFNFTYAKNSWPILRIKIAKLRGQAVGQDFVNLSKLCLEVGAIGCSESAYRSMLGIPSTQTQAEMDLSHLLFLEERDTEALSLLDFYFKNGGNDLRAAFDYARLLSRNQQPELASIYFLKVINGDPKIIQYTAIRHYIDHLIKYKNYDVAKLFILGLQMRTDNTVFFLQRDLDEIARLENSSPEDSDQRRAITSEPSSS